MCYYLLVTSVLTKRMINHKSVLLFKDPVSCYLFGGMFHREIKMC
jgi:hypothetical protein